MVIDDFKLSNVTILLHDSEEFEEDFGGGSDDDLFFSFSLGVNDGLETVSEDVGSGH